MDGSDFFFLFILAPLICIVDGGYIGMFFTGGSGVGGLIGIVAVAIVLYSAVFTN